MALAGGFPGLGSDDGLRTNSPQQRLCAGQHRHHGPGHLRSRPAQALATAGHPHRSRCSHQDHSPGNAALLLAAQGAQADPDYYRHCSRSHAGSRRGSLAGIRRVLYLKAARHGLGRRLRRGHRLPVQQLTQGGRAAPVPLHGVDGGQRNPHQHHLAGAGACGGRRRLAAHLGIAQTQHAYRRPAGHRTSHAADFPSLLVSPLGLARTRYPGLHLPCMDMAQQHVGRRLLPSGYGSVGRDGHYGATKVVVR